MAKDESSKTPGSKAPSIKTPAKKTADKVFHESVKKSDRHDIDAAEDRGGKKPRGGGEDPGFSVAKDDKK